MEDCLRGAGIPFLASRAREDVGMSLTLNQQHHLVARSSDLDD